MAERGRPAMNGPAGQGRGRDGAGGAVVAEDVHTVERVMRPRWCPACVALSDSSFVGVDFKPDSAVNGRTRFTSALRRMINATSTGMSLGKWLHRPLSTST